MLLLGLFFAVFFVICNLLFAPAAHASGLIKPANNLGLVGYWSFEDGKGTTATDFSGKNNKGTLTEMTEEDWVAGKRGRALDFDGSNDYVDFGSPSSLQLQVFSASFWYRGTQTPDSNDAFIGYIQNSGAEDNGWAIQIDQLVNPGKIFARIGSNIVDGHTSFNTFNNGSWHHVVFVNSATNDRKIYVNGILDSYSTSTFAAINYSSAKLTVGARLGSFGSIIGYMRGTFDEVRIYNRALGATEIAALYAGSQYASPSRGLNTIAPNNLVLWHTFDGNKINSATSTDSSGQGNNGTLSGGPVPTFGKIGQALRFTGTDQRVTFGTPSILNLNNNYTLSAWIKPDSLGFTTIIKAGTNTTNDIGKKYALRINSTNLEFPTGDNASSDNDQFSAGISTGAWQMITCSLDSSNIKRCYKNGAFIASSTNSVDTSLLTPTQTHIGGDDNTGGDFIGTIDDVRIYNTTLSAAEVLRLYQQGASGVTTNRSVSAGSLSSGLVLWHTFDGNKLNSSTSTDSSEQGNDGKLNNGPAPSFGKIGQAIRFDGTDDYIKIFRGASSSVPIYNTNAYLTVAGWIKADPCPSSRNIVYSETNAAFGDFIVQCWNTNKKINIGARDSVTGSTVFTKTSTGDVFDNTWHHIAFTDDSGSAKLYIDGVQDATDFSYTPATTVMLSGAKVNIGSRNDGGSLLSGSVDDFRIYNRVVSAEEVIRLYNGGR